MSDGGAHETDGAARLPDARRQAQVLGQRPAPKLGRPQPLEIGAAQGKGLSGHVAQRLEPGHACPGPEHPHQRAEPGRRGNIEHRGGRDDDAGRLQPGDQGAQPTGRDLQVGVDEDQDLGPGRGVLQRADEVGQLAAAARARSAPGAQAGVSRMPAQERLEGFGGRVGGGGDDEAERGRGGIVVAQQA